MFQENLDLFLNDFATIATLSDDSSINGLFDNEHYQADYGDGYVSTSQPRFTCKTTDVVSHSLSQGGVLSINTDTYTIKDIQNDGSGFSEIILKR